MNNLTIYLFIYFTIFSVTQRQTCWNRQPTRRVPTTQQRPNVLGVGFRRVGS